MTKTSINVCENCGLRSSAVFGSLSLPEATSVTAVRTCVNVGRGEVVFSEGTYPRGIFCIHGGHIKLVRTSQDGREQIIRFAGAGDAIGYASLITAEPYSLSAVAVDPSAVCFVPAELIWKFVKDNPEFTLRIMQNMSHELKSTERRVVELAQKSVRERVAEALLVLKETFGTEADGETINTPLSRVEIANIVGTAPESLIRMLAELRMDKIIETSGRSIRLKNLHALARAAKLGD